MAKAKTASPPPRRPVVPAGPDRISYFRGVWEELKKVIWPTRGELVRMTGVVIATVIIFAVIIGVADYALGYAVRQLYTTSATAAQQGQNQAPANPTPTP